MFTAFGALVLALAAPPDAETRRELAKLDGDWRMVSVEVDGAKMPAQQVNGLSLTFKDGKFASYNSGKKTTGTYTIDPKKTPKTLDIVHDEGPEKGKTWALIYRIDGNFMKICGPGEIGKDRPAGFDAKQETGNILMILRHDESP
jgi:uncharacterized protein (TIGR03067 family)